MKNSNSNGCLASLGNLIFIGIILIILWAWATHENKFVRLTFWIFMSIIVYYGLIEPNIDPEPPSGTIQWYDWKYRHSH
jgi:hypothetical protein